MIVLFNSDVLHAEYLIENRLPRHLFGFLLACAANGVTVVVPETALYEFNRDQEKRAIAERTRLENAFDLLAKWAISAETKNPGEVITPFPLMDLIAQTGVEAAVARPTLEDFRRAHEKACRHLPPCPPESSSDEMRDLVIWETALRMAKEHGGALLLSRDEVHIHARGDEEANSFGLRRFREVDDALEYLGSESPVAKRIRESLENIWSDLVEHGFPENVSPSNFVVHESRLIKGPYGVDRLTEARIGVSQPGGGRLQFRLRMESTDTGEMTVKVWDILDATGAEFHPPFELQIVATEPTIESMLVGERLTALREIIEGKNESEVW